MRARQQAILHAHTRMRPCQNIPPLSASSRATFEKNFSEFVTPRGGKTNFVNLHASCNFIGGKPSGYSQLGSPPIRIEKACKLRKIDFHEFYTTTYI